MGLELFGAWEKAHEIVTTMQERFERTAHKAVLQEAHHLRAEIVKGIREGAPGGEPFAPLAPATLATRAFARFRGTKPLLRRGDLRNSISVVAEGDGVFVGVLRKAKTADGKSLANLAAEHEFGAGPIVIPITPKSRAFFHAAMRQAGIAAPASAGGTGGGLAIAIVRIPARPFLRPVFAKEATPEKLRARFYLAMVRELGGDLGT